jgi:hypothetical protein
MRIKRTHSIATPDDASFVELYQVVLAEWQDMPTLSAGQDSDLKYDSARYRVWVSRMHHNDYDGNSDAYLKERIQFEELIDGRWTLLDRYGRLM